MPDRRSLTASLAFVVILLGTVVVLASPVGAAQELRVEVLSSRADHVSGGDALVELVGVGPSWRATVDGVDVSDAFDVRPDGRVIGLVAGLALGENLLEVIASDDRGASITLTNHPSSGPIFSGPHLSPWYCQETAVNEDCDQPTEFAFVYRSSDAVEDERCDAVPSTVTNRIPDDVEPTTQPIIETVSPPCFLPYDADAPPTDVAATTTDEGVEVPYIVRLETGWMDRDQYKVAVLFDPAQPWDPFEPQASWTGRLLIKHGSSCGADFGAGEAPEVLDEGRALGKGFVVMSTALNNSGHNCQPVLQAESMLMAKEHVIEQYGEVRYTMGRGGSGGALAQQWVANSYPGLYDGLLTAQSFTDGWSTAQEIEDCHLMLRYWLDPTAWAPGVVWSPAQMAAAAGHLSPSVCMVWVTVYEYHKLFDPTAGRSCDIPGSERYDAQERPDGHRCSLADYSINILGPRDQDGFAHRPYDNVGVQYGLEALRAGVITPAMFVDLNANLGGRDIDGVWQPERIEAEPTAIERAYRAGLVNMGNNMDEVAVIDVRGTNSVELHHQVRTLTMRARLDAANGHHDNHVIWWGPIATSGDTTFSSAAFDLMDQWLAAVDADSRDLPRAEKLTANKPAQAVDRCTNGRGDEVPGIACELPDATPRLTAGFPDADNIIKCQLQPLDREDAYGAVPFTDAEWADLEAAFPTGICDTSLPGVLQQGTVRWLDYAHGPGGVPMPPPPASIPGAPTDEAADADVEREPLPTTGGGLAAFGLMALGLAMIPPTRRARVVRHG